MDTAPTFPKHEAAREGGRSGDNFVLSFESHEGSREGREALLMLNCWEGCGNGPAHGRLRPLLPSGMFSLQNQAWGRVVVQTQKKPAGKAPQERNLAGSFSRGETTSTSARQPTWNQPAFSPGFSVQPHRSETQ